MFNIETDTLSSFYLQIQGQEKWGKWLLEAQTTITTNEACKQYWPEDDIYDGIVCTGNPVNVTAPCLVKISLI